MATTNHSKSTNIPQENGRDGCDGEGSGSGGGDKKKDFYFMMDVDINGEKRGHWYFDSIPHETLFSPTFILREGWRKKLLKLVEKEILVTMPHTKNPKRILPLLSALSLTCTGQHGRKIIVRRTETLQVCLRQYQKSSRRTFGLSLVGNLAVDKDFDGSNFDHISLAAKDKEKLAVKPATLESLDEFKETSMDKEVDGLTLSSKKAKVGDLQSNDEAENWGAAERVKPNPFPLFNPFAAKAPSKEATTVKEVDPFPVTVDDLETLLVSTLHGKSRRLRQDTMPAFWEDPEARSPIFRAVLDAMTENTEDKALQAKGLQILAVVAERNTDLFETAAAIPVVLASMKRYKSLTYGASVVVQGCLILCRLSIECILKEISAAELIEVLVCAIETMNHYRLRPVIGFQPLRDLADAVPRDELTESIMNAFAIDPLLQTLGGLPDEELFSLACEIFALLDLDKNNAAAKDFVSFRGISRVLAAMTQFSSNELIQENVCKILNMLTAPKVDREKALEILTKCNGIDTILGGILAFPSNQTIFNLGGTVVFRCKAYEEGDPWLYRTSATQTDTKEEKIEGCPPLPTLLSAGSLSKCSLSK